jgi:serine/threonine protein kinase
VLFRPIEPHGELPPAAAPGAVLADRYVVERELGHGGDGTVYLAFDRVAAARVAIKRFDGGPSAHQHPAEGLLRELRCGRAVSHPNVCRIFDVFEAEGHWFLTMEHAAGGTLRSAVGETARRRPLADRVADARAIGAGVAAIHTAGFLHRDIKPENVLRIEDGRIVVSDFGLARAKGTLTASSKAAGTPGYQAPEVATGGESTVASDIYSLGVVLCELFFGVPPRWRPNAFGRAELTVDRSLPAVERALARVCNDCLSQAPASRPKSVDDLERRITSALQVRTTFRRRALVAASVAGLVVMGLATRKIRRPPTPPLPRTVAITGEPADWSSARVLIKGAYTCLDALPPEGTILRAVSPGESAMDIDLTTGAMVPSPLVPDAYRHGCPRVSPDGKWIAYGRPTPGDISKSQIMLSSKPDGSEPVVNASGRTPLWLSKDELLVAYEWGRMSVGNLAGNACPFRRRQRPRALSCSRRRTPAPTR